MCKNNREQAEKQMDDRTYRFAIQFARMWGIAETLEPLPNRGMEEVREKVTVWAIECAGGEAEDPVKFFVLKMRGEFSTDLSSCSGMLPRNYN